MINKVRVGAHYFYYPILLDRLDKPYGAERGMLNDGDRVKVINLRGAPKANVMGHCYIQNETEDFVGLVCTNSLERKKRKEQK